MSQDERARSITAEQLEAIDELVHLEERNLSADLSTDEKSRWRELTERLFGAAGPERRRYFRIETHRDARVEAAPDASFAADLTSLSVGGCFLATPHASPELVGRDLDVTILFPQVGITEQCFHVQVCWVAAKDGTAAPGLGVRFLELGPEQRQFLLQYLRGHLVSMLELSREKYHFFFQHASDVALLLDPEGNVMEASEASAAFLGSTVDALIGAPAARLVDEGSRAALRVALERSRSRERGRLIAQMLSQGSPPIPVEAQLIPFHVRDLRIGTMLVARDLRPQRKLEEQQRSLERQLFQADKLATIGQITASIAHDINNPLAYVLTNLSLLEEYMAPLQSLVELARHSGGHDLDAQLLATIETDLEDLVRESLHGCTRIREIMIDLKDFSRLDGHAASRIDINTALDSALRIVKNLIHHRARLERDYTNGLPVTYLNFGRVSQVLLNLLTNAAYSFERSDTNRNVITVRTRLRGDQIEVAIADNGRGIPAEIRELIFEPFFTTRREEGGTGLGLAIVRECVTSLGGELALETEAGRGTTFRIRLPIRSSRLGVPVVQPGAAPSRRRVLIIDDNATLLRAFERALSRQFEVECTVSALKALELLETRGFDAILCDVMLPNELSGPEFAKRVCARWPELRHKIIFMTGGTFDPEEERQLARLDQMVLAKPIDFNALCAVLSTC